MTIGSQMIAFTLENGNGAKIQAAMAVKYTSTDRLAGQTFLYLRDQPTGNERPRWEKFKISDRLSPYLTGKRPGFVATMAGQITRKMIDSGPITVDSLYVIDVTDHDRSEMESGANPSSLFTRVQRALKEPAPITTNKPDIPEVVEWLVDGPLRTLVEGGDLSPWTTSPIDDKKIVVNAPEASTGMVLSDGSTFYDRPFLEVNGVTVTDSQFMRMVRDPDHRRYLLLLGPAGTGKTAVVEATSDKIFSTLATADTTTLSLLGKYQPNPSDPETYVWSRSALMKSIYYAIDHPDEQVTWYCDEIMQMPDGVQTALHSLTDHRRCLIIEDGPDEGEHFVPDNWHAVFSSNPQEPGSSLSRPFGSRLTPFPYLTNWDVVEKVIGPGFELLLTLAQAMETMRQNGLTEWAPQMRHMVRAADDAKWLGMQYALGSLINACDQETGNCESADVQTLEMLITEHMGISKVKRIMFC